MPIEKTILVVSWVLTTLALLLFIPRDKVRHATLVFLFKQLITWIFGLIVVELRLIEYPVREFKIATQSSFTFDFFVYPAICAIFNIRYPVNSSRLVKFGYYALYCSAMTGLEVILERYTQVIKYDNWEWYWTWITLFMTFYVSRKFYLWFFIMNEKGRA